MDMTTAPGLDPQQRKFIHLRAIVSCLDGQVTRTAEVGYNGLGWLHADVETVAISLNYHEDRKGDYITVSGDWPRDDEGHMVTGRDVGEHNPSINVSAAKPCDVAARDIRRRFLPEFTPIYSKAAAIVRGRRSYAAGVAGNYRLLAEAAGATVAQNAYGRGWRIVGLPEGVSIENVGDNSVRLELTLTPAEACALLKGMAGKPLV